jgi:two-component system sensor histidine kinase YesM
MIFGISAIMLAIFTSIYVSSYIKQSKYIAKDQLSALANNYKNTLDNYKELAVALLIDDHVQDYLNYDGPKNSEYFKLVNNAKSTLQNTINLNSNMNYIALISVQSDDIVYKSTNSKIATNFLQLYKEDYENSSYSCEAGTMCMSFNSIYLGNRRNTMNVYHPVYSVTNMINDIGLLCMVLDSSIVEGLSNNNITGYDSNVFMVDNSSELLSVVDGNQTSFEYGYLLIGDSGSFRMNTDLFIYQKIGNWNYYLISKISLMNMYKNNIIVIIILFVITVAITYFGLIITRRMVKKNYQPLENLIKKMNFVAEGKLDVRINIENVGNDYKKLSNGFNYMMEEINALIIQVKQEQQQMNQLRFNALQSQIQPHFLYNTLDCIHWQAKAEGNEEISVLVKALAQYYRLCLSKGKDMIQIEQELEHVKNYLIIQNIRYDNIIECEINIDDNCRASLIPKITLQPLVENSIYHGIKVKEGKKGVLKITCQKKGEEVIITVEDNGTGMTEEQINEMNQSISQYDKDFGYGIQNVNKRIEILFGREYGLHYEKNKLGGVTVVIHLPNHGIPEYEEVL